MPRPYWRRLVTAALAAASAASFAPLVTSGPASAATTPLTVFAVGDSYASGEGAIGAGWINAGCHRSALAGPQNAAAQLSVLRGVSFTSLACSGSVTGSTTGSGATLPTGATTLLGSSGQLASVGAPGQRVDALSLSIGGNDIGFAGIVKTCMVPVYNCSTDPTVTGPVAAALGSLPARLGEVVTAIQGPGKVVPGSVQNVFVTLYPDPTTGVGGAQCGTPAAPAFEGLEGIEPWEASFASSSIVAPLNAALAGMVAAGNNAAGIHPVWHLVSDIPSRFASHGYCTGGGSPAPWAWFNDRFIATPIDSLTSQGDVMGTLHPNNLGQAQIGAALFAAERFLVDPLTVTVTSSPSPPVIGSPATLTVTARTSKGTAAVGAAVFADGSFVATTSQTGTTSFVSTFPSIGNHTITVDLNPYPTVNQTVNVAGAPYVNTANPNPVPVNVTTSLTLTARAGSAVVPGTYTAVGNTTVTMRSGVTATLKITAKTISYYDTDLRRVVKELVCPTLTFTPDNLTQFSPSDAGSLLNC